MHELSRRKEVEDAIKHAAEEEKQHLMDEAENNMISLRGEISQLKSELSRVKSDCNGMRNENAVLQNTIRRVESRAVDFETVVSSIRAELIREKSEKTCLQERLWAFTKERKEYKLSKKTIAELNSEIEQYRKEIDSIGGDMSELKSELAFTELSLSCSEAICLSTKLELESAKENIDSIMRYEREKQQKFAAKAEEVIETLKGKVAKAESAQKNLQSQVNELAQTLCDKDERIKKLEKSKITENLVASIQKLTVSY